MTRPTKQILSFLICLSVSLSAFAAGGNGKCAPLGSLAEKDLVFKSGENLTYALHYKWGMVNADVARATIKLDTTVLNGKKVFHAAFSGKTQKLYSSLFTVDERLDSWFTRDGLVPMKFTRTAREGNYTCTNKYSYVWTKGNEHIAAALNNSRRGDFSANIPLDHCTYDIPLLLYALRNMDVSKLKEGEKYPMTFAVDNEVFNLHFVFMGKESKKISGLGTVKCMKFAFQVVAGDVFTEGADLYCWISDDGNRIPVFFSAPLKVGQMQGRLVNYSSLKSPFSSKNSK